MTQRKNSQNNGPIDEGWAEYKRLVLSELERLNQAVDKLKDQCVEILNVLAKTREALNQRISELDKDHPTFEQLKDFKDELDTLEKRFLAFKKDQQHDSTISSKWGFWAAVISIIGSLIVSSISLIVALN